MNVAASSVPIAGADACAIADDVKQTAHVDMHFLSSETSGKQRTGTTLFDVCNSPKVVCSDLVLPQSFAERNQRNGVHRGMPSGYE